MIPQRVRSIFLLTTALVCASIDVARGDANEDVARAVATYQQAMQQTDRAQRLALFRQAAQQFRQVVEVHPTAAGWSGVGNAALQAEELGPAILAYRRALELDPAYSQARSNLNLARQRLPAQWQPRPNESILQTVFFWNKILAGSASWWAACAFGLGCLLVAAAIRYDQLLLRNIAVVPFVIWGALLLSVFVSQRAEAGLAAIIVEPDVTAYTADSRQAAPQFRAPLPSGVELTVTETRLDWARVLLPNGVPTWLPRSSLQFVALTPES